MKLKNKVIGTIFGVIASSFVFISVPQSANAGECSAADPCDTYAVVHDGVVTNIIVCQPSVCGSGIFNGQQVVLQKPANPITHNAQGGYLGTQDNPVTYSSEQKTFTQGESTWSVPQTNTAVVDTTTLTAIINPDGLKSNPATISATQGELTESKSFAQSETAAQFEESIKNTIMLKKHLNKFFELLKGWIIN